MTQLRFSKLPRPFIGRVCIAPDSASTQTCVEQSLVAAADVVEVNIAQLSDREISHISFLDLRCYVVCRRREFVKIYRLDPESFPVRTDEERMSDGLELVARGAAGLDIECDTFRSKRVYSQPVFQTACENLRRRQKC
jgi:hypothetical protein